MEDKILKHRKKINGALAFIFMFALISGQLGLSVFAQESGEHDPDDQVTVTANVLGWINLELEDTDLNFDANLVESDGSLNIGTASTEINLATSNPGWTVQVESQNGALVHQDGGDSGTIDAVTDRTELSVVDEQEVYGYGISVGSLADGVFSEEDYEEDGDHVGPLLAEEGVQILNSDDTYDSEEPIAELIVKAATDSETAAGEYSDDLIVTGMADLN